MVSRSSGEDRRALSLYLREIRAFPLLTQQQERRLLGEIEAGDHAASSRLVECNLSFVVKVAVEYRSLGVPFEDLLNEGNLGLLEAARRFDPHKGTKFITYAVWWIRKTILSAVTERSLVVRMPQYQRKKLYELRRAETALQQKLGRPPTREEVAGKISVSESEVEKRRRLHLAHLSLDQPADEEGLPYATFLKDPGASTVDRLLDRETESLVTRAFRRLTPREQAVLGWRFALGGQTALTLKEIGQRMGLSRERVRQIENGAKRRMRRWLDASRRVGPKPV